MDTCNAQDLLSDYDMEGLVTVQWQPRPGYAVSALRPGGTGLFMLEYMNPSVLIKPQIGNMTVTQIKILGTMYSVQVSWNGNSLKGYKDTITDSVTVNFDPPPVTPSIMITPITGDMFVYNFTLQIIGCFKTGMQKNCSFNFV